MIKKKKNLAFILIFTLIITTFSFAAEPAESDIDEKLGYLKSIIYFVKDRYKYDVTEDELMEAAYKGVFDALDSYSIYYNKEEYDRFNEDTSGTFGGIGLEVGIRNGRITIISPIEDTPGARAGFKPGDIIKYVDGVDVSSYALEKAVSLMRGEPGTSVTIGIIRGNNPEPIYINVVREIIKINPVEFKILENNIGYIKIKNFNNNTDENVKKAILELERQDVKGIIVDLRNNPGGLLSEVVRTAGFFLEPGTPVVHIDYKGDNRETLKSSGLKLTDRDLVVLVNEGSASASEIFAGAIQDTGRGKIIGTQTFGKGTVQNVTPLKIGGGIKLTIAEYLSPNERKIDGIGITPDIVVKNPEAENNEEVYNLAPMIEDVKPGLNDKGLNVYGAQQRLKYLGYKVETTGIMDKATFEAIRDFQKSQGLYPYGKLDWTTRDKLNEAVLNQYQNGTQDLQLQRAIEELSR